MKETIQEEEEQPTVLAFDPNQDKFIFGAEALGYKIEGKTNIYNFKKRVGETSIEIEKKYDLWYVKKEGEPVTQSIEDVLEKYFSLINPAENMPICWLIGEPVANENEQWRKRYRGRIKTALGKIGQSEIHFVEEPSAVYEYYLTQNLVDDEKQLIMILDVGGSTFNCTLIDQKDGHENCTVRCADSTFFGGSDLDELLFHEALKDEPSIEKIPSDFFKKKDIDPNILLLKSRLETIKICLSQEHAKKINEPKILEIPPGAINNNHINLYVSAKHLIKAVEKAWDDKWHHLILSVIEKYKKISPNQEPKIKTILMSGGSSNLPLMKEQANKSLTTYVVKSPNFPVIENKEKAVSYGIKALCEKKARDLRGELVNELKTYYKGSLYIGFRRNPKENWNFPKIDGKKNKGQLINDLIDAENGYEPIEVQIPFKVNGNFLIGLFSENPEENINSQLNINDEKITVTSQGILSKCNFNIKITENNQIEITLTLRTKKKNSDNITFIKGPYRLDNFHVIDGLSYIGLDFGHSNTYLSKIFKPYEESSNSYIPSFTIQQKARNQLNTLKRKKDKIISGLSDPSKNLLDYSLSKIDEICYQSTKLEKILIDPPEAISVNSTEKNKIQKESLKETYQAIFDKEDGIHFYKNININLLQYIYAIHKKFGHRWIDDAGSNRRLNVSPSKKIKTPNGVELELSMKELVKIYKERNINIDDPIYAACIFHVALEMIHPFSDGNGRTGRIILDAMCLLANYPPVQISSNSREEYIDCLENAGNGDITKFVLFIIKYLDQALDNFNTETSNVSKNKLLQDKENNSYQSLLDKIRSGEDVLKNTLHDKQKIFNSFIENEYFQCLDTLDLFQTEISKRIGEVNEIKKQSNIPIDYKCTYFDTLSLESYKRFKQGFEKQINFRHLILDRESKLNYLEKDRRKYHFICESDSNNSQIYLRLMFEDINNADLVSPTNTNIVLRTILLCENKDQIELSDGTRLSMNHGIHLFFATIEEDNEFNV